MFIECFFCEKVASNNPDDEINDGVDGIVERNITEDTIEEEKGCLGWPEVKDYVIIDSSDIQ